MFNETQKLNTHMLNKKGRNKLYVYTFSFHVVPRKWIKY